MSKYLIPMHPLDDRDASRVADIVSHVDDMTADERRYLAECEAVRLTRDSSMEDCAEVVSLLTAPTSTG